MFFKIFQKFFISLRNYTDHGSSNHNLYDNYWPPHLNPKGSDTREQKEHNWLIGTSNTHVHTSEFQKRQRRSAVQIL